MKHKAHKDGAKHEKKESKAGQRVVVVKPHPAKKMPRVKNFNFNKIKAGDKSEIAKYNKHRKAK